MQGRLLPRRAHRARLVRNLFLAAASLVVAGAAQARTESEEGVKRVELNVHGRITEHCALGQIDDMQFGDITRPNLSRSARIELSCNVPFQVKIQAANGGLANEQYPAGQGPYAGTLPYTLDISIPVLKPQSAVVRQSFTSRELVGGPAITSGGGIALDGMRLNIALGTPSSSAGLLAGNYAETIVITVAPS